MGEDPFVPEEEVAPLGVPGEAGLVPNALGAFGTPFSTPLPAAGETDWMIDSIATVWPPFNSALSNWIAICEFSFPSPRACSFVTWPINFDPLGMSAPPETFKSSLVFTTTLSPCLADLVSSLSTSSPDTGFKSAAVAEAALGAPGCDCP